MECSLGPDMFANSGIIIILQVCQKFHLMDSLMKIIS